MALLEVTDLSVTFTGRDRADVRAVDGVSFAVEPGEAVGIVGESGSGKSVTSLAIMRLLPKRKVDVSGRIAFEGKDLTDLSDRQIREVRGRDIAMIFQDPMTSLNPVVAIGTQLTEVIRRHRGLSKAAAKDEARQLLDRVGIPDPVRRLGEYPHQLSGGMRQRVMIAIAIACRPKLLIADEPTTALDVTIQAQILDLLRELVQENKCGLIMITHDLGVVAGICDRVHVMYSGRVVESTKTDELFASPTHPYTAGLLKSIPRLDSHDRSDLHAIRGSAGDALPWKAGCAFSPRCEFSSPSCVGGPPPVVSASRGADPHMVRCVHPLTPVAVQ